MSNFSEQIAEEVAKFNENKTAGASFWRSSTVLTDAFGGGGTVFLSDPSIGGDLAIEDIIVQTLDGIGGTGTFKVIVQNASGSSICFLENVSLMGSSETIDLESARLHEDLHAQDSGETSSALSNHRTVLEEGRRIQLEIDGAPTGEGAFTIYIKFSRLARDANVEFDYA